MLAHIGAYRGLHLSLNEAVGGSEQRGVSGVDEDRTLDALALTWGDVYEIYVIDGQWQAWREGAADEDILTGSTPDELDAAIRAQDDSLRMGPR